MAFFHIYTSDYACQDDELPVVIGYLRSNRPEVFYKKSCS